MTHHIQKTVPLCGNAIPAVIKRKSIGRALLPLMVGIALPVIGLSGCAKHSKDHFTVGSTNKGTYKTRHPIVLGEKEQTLDVPVSSQASGLPAASASAIQGFASNYKKSASGLMTIMTPSGSPNQRTARRISERVADVLVEEGVPAGRISIIDYNAQEHGSAAPIRLSYGAVTASVEKCGSWNRDLTLSEENNNYKNFGCATQSNLAAIVSNPADLLGPRGSTGIDAARRGEVIKTYREGTPTKTQGDFTEIESLHGTGR